MDKDYDEALDRRQREWEEEQAYSDSASAEAEAQEEMEMDEEVLKKIAEARLAYIILNWRDNLDNTRMTPQELAQTLMKVLTKEFDWKSPKEKRPFSVGCGGDS